MSWAAPSAPVRARVAKSLVALGSIALAVALVVGWAQRTVFNSGEFAARRRDGADSSVVRRQLAVEITDQLIENGPSSLAAYHAELVGVVDDVVATDGFKSIFRDAVKQEHQAIFERNGAAATLQLGESLDLLAEHASRSDPILTAQLPKEAGSLLVDATPAVQRIDPWRFADDARWLDELALVIAALAFAAAIALDRRRIVFALIGAAITVDGIAITLVAESIPALAARRIHDPSLAQAVAAGVTRFVGDLRTLGLWMIPIGIVIIGAAQASGRAGRAGLPALRSWLRMQMKAPHSRASQLTAGVVVLAVGILIVVFRGSVVSLTVLLAASLIGYTGLVLLIGALLGPAAAATRPPKASYAGRTALALIGSAALLALLAGLIVNVTRASHNAASGSVLRCNGYANLCDKPIDQVAFAASHNSMSAADDPGWIDAENTHGVPAQLDYGIRALLVKTHYGIPAGVDVAGDPVVITDKRAELASDPDAETDELGAAEAQTVQRIDVSVGHVSDQHDIYLCHNYCELGATKFSTTLADIRRFIDSNPDDVLMMIIGNYVTAADTEKAFRQAGLINRLWAYDQSQPAPTLRQMITAKKTLLVFAERGGGSPSWYNQAYGPSGIIQDTPYTFASAAQFSCAANRGTSRSPLFQINHWITNSSPPSVQQARTVNTYDTLMSRVKACEQTRQRFPTIIGVNFYNQGDLLRVVNALNHEPTSET